MKNITFLMLFCVLAVTTAFAQRTISGTITGEDGDGLPGANVRVKGNNNANAGAISELSGRYAIVVPNGATALIFSYTGYETQEIALTSGNIINVLLASGRTLNELVVTALGVKRDEKSIGYSVSQVSGADVSQVRDANIVNQLAGRAAGVTVIGSTGNLGSSARITIRGIKSINGNNQPLFVVDGIPMDNSNFTDRDQAIGVNGYDYGNAIQDINPNDIETISVLKGQAAAALYGSRGANGVIMISTKKGSKSRKGIGVTISSGLTFEKVLTVPKYQKKYGGGVDLRVFGREDNQGAYKTPVVTFSSSGDTTGIYSSFDLVPIYGVDESFGIRYETSTDEHFTHLGELAFGNGQNYYSFYDGFGANKDFLQFRDWNSWDSWDSQNFEKSRKWEAANGPSEFYERGSTLSNNISLEGGGDRSTFRLSYSRLDQKGILPNSNMARNNLGFNGTFDLNAKLSAFAAANYVSTRTTGRSATGYNGSSLNVSQSLNQWWQLQVRMQDLKAYKNPDGSMRTWNRQSAANGAPNYWDNPYWVRYENYENDGRDRIFGNVGLSWKLLPWLTATGRVLSDGYSEFREQRIASGSLAVAKYTLDNINVNETNTDLTLRAEKNVSDDLSVSAFAGGNRLWSTTRRVFESTRGGLNVPGLYRIQNSVERPEIRNSNYLKQINSLFGGVSFGYKSAVYLDLTGRNDWSSSLPNANNSYFYPAASLSYVFSEMVNIPKMSFGKLRLGWAKVGNDTDPYNVFTTYSGNDNFGSNASYTVSNTLNNANLKPEQTKSIEIGTDLRFFKDRIGVDLSLYQGRTFNQIIPLGTTAATGYSRQFINAGEITNKGVELSLNLVPVRTTNFNWDVRVNWGKNINKIVDLNADDPTLTNLPITFFPFGSSFNAYEGQPYGTILGTNYLFDAAGNKLIDPNSGFYMVSTDVMPIGNTTPDWTGGVSTNFSYKMFNFSVFLDGRKGGDIWSLSNLWGKYTGLLAETAVGNLREDGVINQGLLVELDADGAPIQTGGESTPDDKTDDTFKSTGEKSTIANGAQDHFFVDGGYVINAADVYDGSFIKLREISFGVNLPKSVCSKAKIQDAKLSFVARNVAILYKKIPNIDPDNAVSANNIQGSEGGNIPSARSIGVNLTFKF